MNELQLNPIQADADDMVYRGVELKIYGRKFFDLVREVEQPQAKRLGEPSIAGAHEHMSRGQVLHCNSETYESDVAGR